MPIPALTDTSPPPAVYKVKMLRRQRLGLDRKLYKVGDYVDLHGSYALAGAAHLCHCKHARPANADTARDVALFLALRSALPR